MWNPSDQVSTQSNPFFAQALFPLPNQNTPPSKPLPGATAQSQPIPHSHVRNKRSGKWRKEWIKNAASLPHSLSKRLAYLLCTPHPPLQAPGFSRGPAPLGPSASPSHFWSRGLGWYVPHFSHGDLETLVWSVELWNLGRAKGKFCRSNLPGYKTMG